MTDEPELSGHVVLGGFGALGQQVATLLRERGLQVAIIDADDNPDAQAFARELGCRYYLGDVSKLHYLQQARMADARCAIILTGDEQINLQAAIKARKMNPDAPVLVRLFDETLLRHVESIFSVHALSASKLVSPAIVSAAAGVQLLTEFEHDGRVLMIYHSKEGHPEARGIHLNGETLALAINLADTPVHARVCHSHEPFKHPHHQRRTRRRKSWAALHPARLWERAVEMVRGLNAVTWRMVLFTVLLVAFSTAVFTFGDKLSPLDALYFVITTVSTVGYGDISLASAPPQMKVYGILLILAGATLLANLYTLLADVVLTARMEYLLGRRQVRLSEHAIVVGLGATGSRVAHDLHRLNFEVVAIEAHDDAENLAAARAEFPVIIGNANRQSILRMAGVEEAAVVIAATKDPMLNLSVALHAREVNPDIRIVVLTPNAELEETFTSLGFHFVFSTAMVAAPAFVDAALYPHVETSFTAGSQTVLISKLTLDADSPLVGRTVLACGKELGVAPLLDESLQFIAPHTVLQAGQQVVMLLSREKADLLLSPGERKVAENTATVAE